MRFFSTILLTTFVLTLCLGGTSSKVIRAQRVAAPPVVDGLLHDAQWHAAQPASDFMQFSPEEGAAPTESTAVRILYDNDALYIGVICYDKGVLGIVSQLTRRDRTSEADRFTVQLDTYHDHQSAFVFTTNAAGVQSDGVLSQSGNVYDLNYDAVWRVETARHREGWSAEFKIPFSAIRFTAQASGVYEWGVNFRRYISRKQETDEWVMVPSTEGLLIDKWGHVVGIKSISSPLNLSVIPYISAGATFETASPTRPYQSERSASAGLDIKYGISPNITLDAAFNPDFGQVEVDQAILNLTVFETFYPEKRPFFIEGASVFEFGATADDLPLRLFFSRRIGQRPGGSFFVSAPPGGRIEKNPLTTTILGAAKVTGRTESGLSLGLLASVTDEEQAILDSFGIKTKLVTEPTASYNALRLKQEFGDNSWLGMMATLAGRDRLQPAFSGGIDWNVRLDAGTYALDGYVAGVHSSAEHSNPEGGAGKLLFARITADHWFYSLSYNFFSAHFDNNDLGFFNEARYHGGYVQLMYKEPNAEGALHRWSASAAVEGRWNWDRVRTLAAGVASLTVAWSNFWQSSFEFVVNDHAYDDAEVGINGLYLRPVNYALSLTTNTATQKPVSLSFGLRYMFDELRKKGTRLELSTTIRPTAWAELTPSFVVERTTNEQTGVFDFASGLIATDTLGYSLIADRDVANVEIALRGIVTFTRELSLQFYTQVLQPRGRYDSFRSLVGERLIPYPQQQYDFNQANFIANVLLRWEFLPGSTAFLVWTQSRNELSGAYDVGFGTRFRETFKLPHDDAVLLKVSYGWNL
jgi:hypothetical protein